MSSQGGKERMSKQPEVSHCTAMTRSCRSQCLQVLRLGRQFEPQPLPGEAMLSLEPTSALPSERPRDIMGRGAKRPERLQEPENEKSVKCYLLGVLKTAQSVTTCTKFVHIGVHTHTHLVGLIGRWGQQVWEG